MLHVLEGGTWPNNYVLRGWCCGCLTKQLLYSKGGGGHCVGACTHIRDRGQNEVKAKFCSQSRGQEVKFDSKVKWSKSIRASFTCIIIMQSIKQSRSEPPTSFHPFQYNTTHFSVFWMYFQYCFELHSNFCQYLQSDFSINTDKSVSLGGSARYMKFSWVKILTPVVDASMSAYVVPPLIMALRQGGWHSLNGVRDSKSGLLEGLLDFKISRFPWAGWRSRHYIGGLRFWDFCVHI